MLLARPQYNFTRRSSQQFFADYEEVTIFVDGDVIPLAQDPVTQRFLEPSTLGARSDSSFHLREEESLNASTAFCLPPSNTTERENRHREVEPFYEEIP